MAKNITQSLASFPDLIKDFFEFLFKAFTELSQPAKTIAYFIFVGIAVFLLVLNT